MKNIILSVALFLITISAFCKCGNDNSQTENKQTSIQTPSAIVAPPTIQIDAKQLINEYINNEVRANDNYKNHALKVTAVVSDITQTADNVPIVICAEHIQGLYEIVCGFRNRDDVGKINVGNLITFEGECLGISNYVIVINNCALQ